MRETYFIPSPIYPYFCAVAPTAKINPAKSTSVALFLRNDFGMLGQEFPKPRFVTLCRQHALADAFVVDKRNADGFPQLFHCKSTFFKLLVIIKLDQERGFNDVASLIETLQF